MKQQEKEKEYEAYVKEKTPVRKPGPAMAKAFVTGGIICTIGQAVFILERERQKKWMV